MDSVKRSVGWAVAGAAIPVLVALAAIPVLSRNLSSPLFGLVSLALVFLGTFSIVDLGFGRNLVLVTSRWSTRPEAERANGTGEIWLGIVLVLIPGLTIGLAMFVFSEPISAALGVSNELAAQAINGIRIVAITLPAVSLHAALRAICEGLQDFGSANRNKILTGVMTVSAVSASACVPGLPLEAHVLTLALTRVLCMAHLAWKASSRGHLAFVGVRQIVWRLPRHHVRDAIWVSVATLLGPVTTYLDKLLVATVVAVSDLPLYSVPSDTFTKLLIVPGALTSVLLTIYSRQPGRAAFSDPRSGRMTRMLLAYSVVSAGLALTLAEPALRLLMGPLYSESAVDVGRIFIIGIAFNAVAHLPYARLQANGQSHWIAKLHVAELLLYGLAALWLTRAFGVSGAAWAWSLRAAIDCGALYALERKKIT